MKNMYKRAQDAQSEGVPVAWIAASPHGAGHTFVTAICEGLGILPLYPENFATLCAARGVAVPFIEGALSQGFSNSLCGYTKVGLGYAGMMAQLGGIPPEAPGSGMARPTILLACTDNCDVRKSWFLAMQRYLDVPYHCFDVLTPFPGDLDVEGFRGYYIEYLVGELKACVDFLERQVGRKLDEDKMSEILEIGLKTARVWYECHELRKAVPCPMPSQDMWAMVGPGFFLMGKEDTLVLFRSLYEELKYRVDNKIGAIPEEKYRLMFGGLPPYHGLAILNYLEMLGAVCVIETVTYYPGPPPVIPASITDPYEHLAWWHYRWFTFKMPRTKEGFRHYNQVYLDWAADYGVDGTLLHEIASCRVDTIGFLALKDLLLKYRKVPSLIVEGDLIDPRDFDEARFKMEMDAFIEIMDRYRKVREEDRAG